jgi:ribosome-binding protein aMBF1 (putative translation factor)
VTKTANRSDVHSPTHLVTEDYEYVGGFDNDLPDFGGNRARLRQLIAEATTTRYGTGVQCDHCGAHIRYVGVVRHIPTGDHLAVGEVCLDNRFGRATADFQAMRKAAQLDREKQRLLTASNEFRADHADVDWLALDESENGFVQDVIRRLRQYGSLSDKQLAAIQTAVVRDAERAVRQAAEALIPKGVVPEGKGLVIEGEVLSTKWQDSDYGGALKMLVGVDTPDGAYKVWGTVPSKITVERGDIVRLTANVTRSSKDADFGFFSRPRLASIVE